MGFDIIGDVHGHLLRLEALLTKLGYRRSSGCWCHPKRVAVFVGDLIDRGPGQIATLTLVRTMVDEGAALAVMGNHEFNAIGWHTPHSRKVGDHHRTRLGAKGVRNRSQHTAFLEEVGEDSRAHEDWIGWLWQLPLWIDRPHFRVVHACWSPAHIKLLRSRLREGRYLTPEVLELGSEKGNPLYDAVETVLKGIEVKLPPGISFHDKEGHQRREIRTRWWDTTLRSFRTAYIGPLSADMPDIAIPHYDPPPEVDRPTFIGHYWLDPSEALSPVADRVACLDYSVAKGGPLVAYRFDGEAKLSPDKFESV